MPRRDLPAHLLPDPVQVRLAAELRKREADLATLQHHVQLLQHQSQHNLAVLTVLLERLRREDHGVDEPLAVVTQADMQGVRNLTVQIIPSDEGMRCFVLRSDAEIAAGRERVKALEAAAKAPAADPPKVVLA